MQRSVNPEMLLKCFEINFLLSFIYKQNNIIWTTNQGMRNKIHINTFWQDTIKKNIYITIIQKMNKSIQIKDGYFIKSIF